MRRRLFVLLAILCWLPLGCSTGAEGPPAPPTLAPGPEDTVEFDEWLNGTLNGDPVANMHMVVVRHPDDTRTTLSDTVIRFQRELMGSKIDFAVTETNLFREDAEGYLTGFQISQAENGARTTAVGHVFDDRVEVVVHHPRNRTEDTIQLPAGVRLLGVEAAQRQLAERELAPGDSMQFHSVALMFGTLRLVSMTATYVETLADGHQRFSIVLDQIPGMAMDTVIDEQGYVQRVTMAMGPLSFAFVPGTGPIPLGEAELSMEGLITHEGPPPRSAARNRYRLSEAVREHLVEDGFQQFTDDDVLVVTTAATPSELADADPYLMAEAQIEIQDQELRDWVAEQLADAPRDVPSRARILSDAVSARLVGNLAHGDASALEAFHNRQGDCTEHANLLCAALRIAGIPSRVEVGFVYASQLGGWGGHAWNSAYDAAAGRWIHLDSAYPGVPRSCYIRTGSPNAAEQATGTLLDGGMSLMMGETIEVLAPEAPQD